MPKLSLLGWFFLRCFLGSVFVFAGFSKLIQPIENFRGLLADYTILPYTLIPFIASFFPWVEIFVGVFLILGFFIRPSAALLAFISLTFIVVMALSRYILGFSPASCGCFGDGPLQLTTGQVMILDAFMILAGIRLALMKEHPFSLDRFMSHYGSQS